MLNGELLNTGEHQHYAMLRYVMLCLAMACCVCRVMFSLFVRVIVCVLCYAMLRYVLICLAIACCACLVIVCYVLFVGVLVCVLL